MCASCLLCGHPFPAHLLDAVGSFIAEDSGGHPFGDAESGPLGLADVLAEPLLG